MTRRSLARATLLVAALVTASPALAWKLVNAGEPFVHKRGFSVQLPEGWRWIKGMAAPGEVAATRDGLDLQVVYVDWRKHKGAFPALKEDATPGMPPQELAEKFAANAKVALASQNLEVLASEPATVAGRPGFSVHLAYRASVHEGSVRYQERIVGVNAPEGIFIIVYRAPVLHYFAKDVAAFERAVESFTLNGGG